MFVKLKIDIPDHLAGEVVEVEPLELNCVRIGQTYLTPMAFEDQPDRVCCCGRTSIGICPRCGQNMGEEE